MECPIDEGALAALLAQGVCALVLEGGPCGLAKVGEVMTVSGPQGVHRVRVMSRQPYLNQVILVIMDLPGSSR